MRRERAKNLCIWRLSPLQLISIRLLPSGRSTAVVFPLARREFAAAGRASLRPYTPDEPKPGHRAAAAGSDITAFPCRRMPDVATTAQDRLSTPLASERFMLRCERAPYP